MVVTNIEEKKFNIVDQAAHSGSCCVFTLLTVIPLLGAIVVVVWAITREYYQTKETMRGVFVTQAIGRKPKFVEIMKNIDYFKRDLRFSYLGVAVGICAGAALLNWAL